MEEKTTGKLMIQTSEYAYLCRNDGVIDAIRRYLETAKCPMICDIKAMLGIPVDEPEHYELSFEDMLGEEEEA